MVKRRPGTGRLRSVPLVADRLPHPLPDVSAERFSLTLPVPPSINHQYATVNGRRLLSAAGRSYKALVGQQIVLALARSPYRHALLKILRAEDLALSIRFYFTSRLRRDVDGGLKIAQDALCEGLGINDNRIVETHLYKNLDKLNPRIEIVLSPVTAST
jgi:crossover junction endodeoxyribonuclease RusA